MSSRPATTFVTALVIVLLFVLVGAVVVTGQQRNNTDQRVADALDVLADSDVPADAPGVAAVEDGLEELRVAVDGLASEVAELHDLLDVPASDPVPVETTEPAEEPGPVAAGLDCSPHYEGGAVGCVDANGVPVCGAATNDGGQCANDVVCPDDPHWCWSNCAPNYPQQQIYAEVLAGIRDRGCPDRYADGERQCVTNPPPAALFIDGYYVSDTC